MGKDFRGWFFQKARLNGNQKLPVFCEREIWFVSLGANVGVEQDGKGEEFVRPVLILRKFSKDGFWAIPLTSVVKPPAPFRFQLSFVPGIISTANLSQLRFLDARRLRRKAGIVTWVEFKEIRKRLRNLIS